jgi:hypothetical protein
MRKLAILLPTIFLCSICFAQRISTGITVSTPAFHRTTLPDNFLFPTNSYFIYYTANSDKDDDPIYDQYLNGFNGGVNVNVDYKRWMLTTEILGGQTTVRLPVLYRSDVGTLLEDNWSTLEVQNINLQVNILVSARLSARANGFFLQGGLQYANNSYNEKSKSLDADISPGIRLWISDYEMYEILYTNNFNQFNAIAGLGYKYLDSYTSFRISQPISSRTNRPLANYLRVDAVHARTLNFQKLRKGHKIYVE